MQLDFVKAHMDELRELQMPVFAPLVPFNVEHEPPDFPVDAMPFPVSEYAKANAEFLQVDPAMIAIPCIGTISTCVQGRYVVEAKPGHREPLGTYTGVEAASGERKTPSMGTGKRPLQKKIEIINRERKLLIDAYDDELEITRQRIKNAQKKAVAAAGKEVDLTTLSELRTRERSLEENPVRPLELYIEDTTPEGLLEFMSENGGRGAIFSDEGGVITTLAGTRYGNGGAWIDPMLKAYSGDETKVNRATKAPIKILNPRLTICVMMQKTTVDQMMANPEFLGRGLLARFLIALPKSLMGKRRYDTTPPPQDVVDTYNTIVEKLLEAGTAEGEEVIYFSQKAKDFVEAVHNEIEPEFKDLDEDSPLRAWLGKLHGQFVRLCGILHCINFPDDPAGTEIDEYTCADAWKLGHYFWDCAKILYSDAADDAATRDAKYILKRIQDKGVTKIGRGELLQTCKRFHKADELDAGLDVLQERGYIAIEKITGNGRPAVNVLLNPKR